MYLVYFKKIDSIRTKVTKEIDFEVCPYGDSGNGTAAAARARRHILIEPAAWRRAAIEARGRSELGAQPRRKNQPACPSVSCGSLKS